MSKPAAPIFCETQCSDGEEDDYIDQLIRRKGANALNELLKDNEAGPDKDSDHEEIIELRDSLMPIAEKLVPQKQIQIIPVQAQQAEEQRTPKYNMGYHKRKIALNEKNEPANQENTELFSKSQQVQQFSSKHNLNEQIDEQQVMEQEMPELEHQDTIVRQSSSTSQESTPFCKHLSIAIKYFSSSALPIPVETNPRQQQYQEQNDLIQKQLIMENQDLKKEINKLHQRMYQVKAKNKDLQNRLVQSTNQAKPQAQERQYDQQDIINDLQLQLQQLNEMYLNEKQDKEHSIAAYQRFIQRINNEKDSNNNKQSFLSSISSVAGRKSPSPTMRQSIHIEMPHNQQQQIIQQLQDQLSKKDNEIRHFKKHSAVYRSSQHLHSEENVLDDLEKDDQDNQYIMSGSQYLEQALMQNQYHQQESTKKFGHRIHLKTNDQQQKQSKHGSMQNKHHHQEYYSYERAQSPLPIQQTQSSHLPTTSSSYSYIARPHSPSLNMMIPQQKNQEASYLQAHHAKLRNQSPSMTQNHQSRHIKNPLSHSLAFQVNVSQQNAFIPQKRVQTEALSMSIQTPLSMNQTKSKKQNQYLFTNSSGGSGYGYPGTMPMMSSSGCGSEEDI